MIHHFVNRPYDYCLSQQSRRISAKHDLVQGEKFPAIADGQKIIYRHTHDVNNLFINPPTHDFVLISHNSDGVITDDPREFDADTKLIPPSLKLWFGQNVAVTEPRIESIPIGLENSNHFPGMRKVKKMVDILNREREKTNILYINHNIMTNLPERLQPYSLFHNKHWATLEGGSNGLDFSRYLLQLYSHDFVLSPPGNGIDTHRKWEALYLGTIPIEKRNANNLHYSDLPICFVDSWEEITEDFLRNEYKRIKKMVWSTEKLFFSFWKRKILSTANHLLETGQ